MAIGDGNRCSDEIAEVAVGAEVIGHGPDYVAGSGGSQDLFIGEQLIDHRAAEESVVDVGRRRPVKGQCRIDPVVTGEEHVGGNAVGSYLFSDQSIENVMRIIDSFGN